MHNSTKPSDWLIRWSKLINNNSKILDLACGSGRNSFYLARNITNISVHCVDKTVLKIDDYNLKKKITFLKYDLERNKWPYKKSFFDCIIVFNYLHRPLFPKIIESLKENGLVIYQTFGVGNELYGKPSNPQFLLNPNELLEMFSRSLNIISYESGIIKSPSKAVIQRVCAKKKFTPQDL